MKIFAFPLNWMKHSDQLLRLRIPSCLEDLHCCHLKQEAAHCSYMPAHLYSCQKENIFKIVIGAINPALGTSNWFQTDCLGKDIIGNSDYLLKICHRKNWKHLRTNLWSGTFPSSSLAGSWANTAHRLSDTVPAWDVTAWISPSTATCLRELTFSEKTTKFQKITGNYG